MRAARLIPVSKSAIGVPEAAKSNRHCAQGARLSDPQSLRLVDGISHKGFGGDAARQPGEDLTNGLAVRLEDLTMSPGIVLAGQQPIRIDPIRRNDPDQNVECWIRRGLIGGHAQRNLVHPETLCCLFEILAGDQTADP